MRTGSSLKYDRTVIIDNTWANCQTIWKRYFSPDLSLSVPGALMRKICRSAHRFSMHVQSTKARSSTWYSSKSKISSQDQRQDVCVSFRITVRENRHGFRNRADFNGCFGTFVRGERNHVSPVLGEKFSAETFPLFVTLSLSAAFKLSFWDSRNPAT